MWNVADNLSGRQDSCRRSKRRSHAPRGAIYCFTRWLPYTIEKQADLAICLPGRDAAERFPTIAESGIELAFPGGENDRNAEHLLGHLDSFDAAEYPIKV
jgi:hypothetical protein